MRVKIYSIVLAVFLLTFAFSKVGNCENYNVQAPFDSFVCFQKSFNECYAASQANALQKLRANLLKAKSEPKDAKHSEKMLEMKDNSNILIDDTYSNTTKTKDQKYECMYGKIPYDQNIKPNEKAPVVFVSPMLLREIDEQQIKLDRVRTTCARLIEAYDFQMEILDLQDKLSLAQKAVSMYSAEVERDRLTKETQGARKLPQQEADIYKLPKDTLLREALKMSRENVVNLSEELRNKYKNEVTEKDFKRQFEDANINIDLQLRELARDLFVLDRSIPHLDKVYSQVDYDNASWVEQGTIVLSTQPENKAKAKQ